MSNTGKHECDNCIWRDWCDIHDPNNELCGLHGNEVVYENSLMERAEAYFEEILEYDDSGIEMF